MDFHVTSHIALIYCWSVVVSPPPIICGFGPRYGDRSQTVVAQGALRSEQTSGVNHLVVREVSWCSLCVLTKPCNQCILFRLWFHMGKGETYQTLHGLKWFCFCKYSKCFQQPGQSTNIRCQTTVPGWNGCTSFFFTVIYWWIIAANRFIRK